MLQPINLVVTTPEDAEYGDVVLDQRGIVFEKVRDSEYGEFEWLRAYADDRNRRHRSQYACYGAVTYDQVAFPVTVIARSEFAVTPKARFGFGS